MKLTTIEARMGHAPDEAICTQGQKIRFTESIMQGLSDEVVSEIKSSGGQLPDVLAVAVASNGCSQYVDGKCKLLNMALCER